MSPCQKFPSGENISFQAVKFYHQGSDIFVCLAKHKPLGFALVPLPFCYSKVRGDREATRLPPESAGETVGSPPLRRLLRRREGVGTPVLRVGRVHRVRTRFPGGGGPVGTPPRRVGLPQLRSHHGGALRCAADELVGVDSCRHVRAARIGCSHLSMPAARFVFHVWVGEAVVATRAEDFAPWPRLRCGSARSGAVGRSVEGLYRSPAGAACFVQERRCGRPLGGFCSRAGWWFGGRRSRRVLFRASRRRAAGPGPVAFQGLPRPTSYKVQVSAAARRTTLSAHKAMRCCGFEVWWLPISVSGGRSGVDGDWRWSLVCSAQKILRTGL